MRKPKKQQKPLNDLSRSLTPFDPNQTLIIVVELSKKSWVVAGIIPGVERQPLKKLAADEQSRALASGGTRSSALPSPSRPAGTAFGFPAG